jgi:hypothetical protein
MTDYQVSAGGLNVEHRLEYTFQNDPVPGRVFELVVTSRAPSPNSRIAAADRPTGAELSAMIARTMTNWKNVMQAIIFDTALPDNRLAAIKAIRTDVEPSGIPESDTAPYVTVWNMTNYYKPGLSVTIHSYDNGDYALAVAQAHIAGVSLFNEHCGKLGFYPVAGNATSTPPPAANSSTPPAVIGSSANPIGAATPPAQPITFNPFVRSIKPGQFAGSISIEGGQTATPNWTTQAHLATQPFVYKAVQYTDGALVAYRLKGALQVKEYEGKRNISIPFVEGGFCNVYNKGGEHDYEWAELTKKLGLSAEQAFELTAGTTIPLPQVHYVVLKFQHTNKDVPFTDADGKPVAYAKFYGFYASSDEVQAQQPAPDVNDIDAWLGTNPPQGIVDEIPF